MRVVYVLLAIFIPIGELHQIFYNVHREVDVFLFIDYSIDIQWVIKDLGQQAQYIILAYVAYRVSLYSPNISSIRGMLFAIFIFTLIDAVLYFVAFKRYYFSLAYYSLACITLYTSYKKGLKRKNKKAQ